MTINQYSLVLWGQRVKDSKRLITAIMKIFRDYFPSQQWFLEDQPTELFPLDPHDIDNLVDEKKQKNEFSALHIFLISSMGIKFSFTASIPLFVRKFDVVSLSFDEVHFRNEVLEFDFEKLISLFETLLIAFKPFWGAIRDNRQISLPEHQQISLSLQRTAIPTAFYWVNFFGQEMVDNLGGMQKMKSLVIEDQRRILDDPIGIMMWFHEIPFDYSDPRIRELIAVAEKQVSLQKIQDRFRK
jgi:hypothetical protein